MTETHHTSDGAARPNALTGMEWLDCVLDSGRITRVTQHLALVIFAMAIRQQRNGVSVSVRDLERKTGWSKSMIADHLEELGDFIQMTLGTGRRKSVFELQAEIADALKNPVASADETAKEPCQQPQPAEIPANDASSVRALADATPEKTADVQAGETSVRMSTADATADATENSKISVRGCADAMADATTGDEPPLPPKRKVPPCTPLKENNPPPPNTPQLAHAREPFAEPYLPSPAAMKNPAPHMNGVGFVISEAHGLVIPAKTVDRWRTRFAELPDLEAAMGRLSCNLLSRGTMHPGWSCPEGWMAGILADMNQQAKDKKRVADAKIAATKPKTFKPSRW